MKLIKLLHTARYLQPSQILARLRLTLKRNACQKLSGYLNQRYRSRNESFTISEEPPRPIFNPKKGLFFLDDTDPDQFKLTFLNNSRTFKYPINWHPKELETGTRLWKLNLHYMEYLEEVDDKWFCRLTEDWIAQNPPYREGYWLDSWNSFALSIRTVVWMQQIARRHKNLKSGCIQATAASIYKQLLFLENNLELDIKGNHLVKNMKALLWGAAFFKADENTHRWKEIAKSLLRDILSEQVLDDGMHYERSPAYHCQVFADLIECHNVLDPSGLRSELKLNLHKMGEALSALTHPDGQISLFNDGGLNMSYSPDDLMKMLEISTGQKAVSSDLIELRDAGYYGLRQQKCYFLFDAGKIGPDELPAHGHGDIFSFELSIGKERIIVDKGVFEYDEGPLRRESRSTLSHNTLNIAGEDQCEFYGSFRVASRPEVTVRRSVTKPNLLSLEASHNGYKHLTGRPLHCRFVEMDQDVLIIEDRVTGGSGQQAEARFLLHPKADTCHIDSNRLRLTAGEVQLTFETACRFELKAAKWFPDFGVSLRCEQIIVYLGNAPCKARYHFTFT